MEPTLDTVDPNCKKEKPVAESRDNTPLELRFVNDAPELRTADDSVRHINGFAASFNKLSRRLGGFHEQVMPTAFNEARSAEWPNVVCRYNHSKDYVLGTIHGGTLDLEVRDMGLHYDVRPPSTRADIMELVQRKDVRYSSFAFRCNQETDDSWGTDANGYPLRSLHSLELVDVAPVLDPAYFDTTATARNMAGVVESLSRHMNAEPEEVRSMLDDGQLLRFIKRTDRSSNTSPSESEERDQETPVSTVNSEKEPTVETETTEDRAKLNAKARNALPDSAFAYIDEKGERHLPIHDKAHVTAALRLGPQTPFWSKAKGKVHAAAKKHGIDTSETEKNSIALNAEVREMFENPQNDEQRAAKANYEDLNTCGNCAAKDQWGKHCTQCGNPMREMPGKPAFCGECGSKIKPAQPAAPVAGKRDAEDDSETRESEEDEEARAKSKMPPNSSKDAPDNSSDAPDNTDDDPDMCSKTKACNLKPGHDGPCKPAASGKRDSEEESEERGMSLEEASAKMAELRTRMLTSLDD